MVHSFVCSVDQRIIRGVQGLFYGLQLGCLNMLDATFNLDQALSGHIAAINLQDANKIGLAHIAFLPDSADIGTDADVLFDFLIHILTSSGLDLVHLSLFYEMTVI